MTLAEAVELLRAALPSGTSRWADLGAGAGTFTEALAHLLGPAATVVAVDHDAAAVEQLRSLVDRLPADAAAVVVSHGDLTELESVAAVNGEPFDGVLFGNVLHYFADPTALLNAAASLVVPGGSIIVLEYDRALANSWVPHPVSVDRLAELARDAGLAAPRIVAERRSRYHGTLYCALLSASR